MPGKAKKPGVVAVLTGDIIGSSRYAPADRRRVDRVLRAAFKETERRFPEALLAGFSFRITAGDEFQCVIGDVASALDVLFYLRAMAAGGGLDPPLRFRAALGVGRISVLRGASSYEQDGPAFVRSRAGLERVARQQAPPRWTAIITGEPELDATAEAVLGLADNLVIDWTVPQWQAVRWMLLGETRLVAARRLDIAHQNVSKRLLAAGWHYLEPALDFLAARLARAASP